MNYINQTSIKQTIILISVFFSANIFAYNLDYDQDYNNQNNYTKSESVIYIGYGVSQIQGKSEGDDLKVAAPMFVVGAEINDRFAAEISFTVKEVKGDDVYDLDHFGSVDVVANIPFTNKVSMLGKIGWGELKMSRTDGKLNGTYMQVRDLHYGVGARYQHSKDTFIDAIYEKVANKVVDERDEDISQFSIIVKNKF